MQKYYLAVDIGASGGRHILAYMQDGKMQLEEVYRFENGMKHVDGKLIWDTGYIFAEILNGMKRCRAIGKIPKEIEANIGKKYDAVHIIGGGSKAAYLNQLTADATGKTVYAGPGEAAAAGNILAQMIADGVFEDLKAARACVRESFAVERYTPE